MQRLFGRAGAESVGSRLRIRVPTRSLRHPARDARDAEVALRWSDVRLRPPRSGDSEEGTPASLRCVHVGEEGGPARGARLEWLLLTNLPVRDRGDAERVLQRYLLRRRFDEWRRVLWSGCKVDELGHRKRERVGRTLTIKAVIAWRLAAMAVMGRKTPDLPLRTLFSDAEIAALKDFARYRGLPPPKGADDAVRITAVLGGYLNRKSDPAPGTGLIWEGFSRLAVKAQTYEMLERLGPSSSLYPRLARSSTSE